MVIRGSESDCGGFGGILVMHLVGVWLGSDEVIAWRMVEVVGIDCARLFW